MYSKKKVALCFSGGVRNLIDNIDSIKKCLIEPVDADVFIHGWYFKLDEIENKHKMYTKDETSELRALLNLKPKKFSFEIYDKNKENEIIKKLQINQIKKKYKNNIQLCQLYPNTCGMFWSIYQSNKLKIAYEKEHQFTYDIVIRCRPDFEYYTKLTYNILNLVSTNTILLPLDNYAFSTKQCDKFAIGTSSDMDKYADLINNILDYEKIHPKNFWDGPNILKIHLDTNKINTKWIFYDYDYHIRKKSQRLTKDKLKKIKYDNENHLIIVPDKYNNIFKL